MPYKEPVLSKKCFETFKVENIFVQENMRVDILSQLEPPTLRHFPNIFTDCTHGLVLHLQVQKSPLQNSTGVRKKRRQSSTEEKLCKEA